MTHHGAKKAKSKSSSKAKEFEPDVEPVEEVEEEAEPDVVESENEAEREEDFEPQQEQTVKPEVVMPAGFAVTPATIDFKSDSQHVQLKVTDAAGTDVTAQVKFGSEDGSVAVVTPTGLVSPVRPGTCRISANAASGAIAFVAVKVS